MNLKDYKKNYIYINDDLVHTSYLNDMLKIHPEYINNLYEACEEDMDIRNDLEDLIRDKYYFEFQNNIDEEIFYDNQFSEIVMKLNTLIKNYCPWECYKGNKLEV